MGKLINRIPGSRLLISSLPGSPCLVNLISKDTHLVFSIYRVLLSLGNQYNVGTLSWFSLALTRKFRAV